MEQAIERARGHAHAYSLAYSLNWAAIVSYLRGDFATLAEAGVAEVAVQATSLGQALHELEAACPPLAGPVLHNGLLSCHYRLSLNGRRFISDPDHGLAAGDRLILLSAEAGG